MKKQTASLLLIFVLAWLAGLHEAGHSQTLVSEVPVDVATESAQLEEELPAATDLTTLPVLTAFFLVAATSGIGHSVRVSRFVHLTPVFYEGGYLSGFYEYV